MSNPYNLYINRPVSYRTGDTWTAARVVSFADADNAVLERKLKPGDGRAAINGGVAVPRLGSASAAGTVVNTWRPY